MNIRIFGGRVVDPANQIDQIADVYISEGKITAIGEAPAGFEADQEIDASHQVVAPGLVDMSAHMREPGQTQKGTILSESAAAAAGGVTSLVTPPNNKPITDTAAVAKLIGEKAEQAGYARIYPVGALTRGLEGEQLAPMHALAQSGCIAFSNMRQPINSSLVLMRTLEYAATHDLLVIFQPQDADLAKGGCMRDGANCTRLGLNGISEAAETVEVSRCLLLAEQTGVRAHFGQLSTEKAVRMVMEARQKGLNVSADVPVHHLILTDENVNGFDSNFHLIPPLGSQLDRAGLRQALMADGIQAICSDHQPHEAIAKEAPFAATEPGISGLETLLSLSLTLVHQGLLELPQLLHKLTAGPAQVLGIEAGTLSQGATADICIFDPEMSWQPTAENLRTAGKNTPFTEVTLTGRVTNTLLGGKLVYQL